MEIVNYSIPHFKFLLLWYISKTNIVKLLFLKPSSDLIIPGLIIFIGSHLPA